MGLIMHLLQVIRNLFFKIMPPITVQCAVYNVHAVLHNAVLLKLVSKIPNHFPLDFIT